MLLGVTKLVNHSIDPQHKSNNGLKLCPIQKHSCYNFPYFFEVDIRYQEENSKSLFTKRLQQKYENRVLPYELLLL